VTFERFLPVFGQSQPAKSGTLLMMSISPAFFVADMHTPTFNDLLLFGRDLNNI
jgi:hypothetical protein